MARQPAGERDYRDLKPKSGQKPHNDSRTRQTGGSDTRWWLAKGKECASAVHDTVEFLQKVQTQRMRQQVISARLYGNISLSGASGAAYTRMMQSQTATKDRVTYNATQEIIDTLVARVGETKPRPYFLTDGGSYKQQRKAKKLNQFVEGVFYETKTYDLGLEAFRDAAIWGDGFIHVYGQKGRVCHERVWGNELWVDEVEAQYGYPRNMHRLKVVDKDELAAVFPEHREAIMGASRAMEGAATAAQTISDMVTVAESWHLGTRDEDGKVVGGVHAIALVSAGVMLVEPEEWPHDFFPFARMSWCKRPVGYWSQGLCEQLQGDQIELNKELWLIQRSMHLAGSFKILLRNGSKVVKEALSNEVGAIITYTGERPEYITPAPINEVYFQNTNTIIERMRNRAGVSQMSTAGKKPMGLNSGAAIREFEDVESDRHRSISRANDNLYLEIAALDIAIANEMTSAGKLKQVRTPSKTSFAAIDWKKDISKVKADEFVMQCFPVSRLPRDPSGRLQTIQEYIQAGMISPRQGRRALDFADIDSIESLANAQEDIIVKNLDAIIDDGVFNPPEPTDDLSLCKEMVLEYIQRYRQLDLEDEKLDMLRDWNSQVDALQSMAQQQMAAQQAALTPQAAPMAPPQSDLIPNVPAAP